MDMESVPVVDHGRSKPQVDHLLTFYKVAALGSISAAADELGVSQPAISVQMRNLANAVGEPILRRYKGGIALTPIGRSLLPYATQLVKSYRSTLDYVDSLRAMMSGSISIASSNTIAAHLLPSLIASFSAIYPDIGLVISTTNSQGVVDGIRELHADLGFIEGPVRDVDSTWDSYTIGHDSVVLVFSDAHQELVRSMSVIEMLTKLPFVFREKGSGTRQVVEMLFESMDIAPRMVIELAGTEAVREAVLSGIGASLLSSLSVRREVEMGYLHQVDLDFDELKREFTLLVPSQDYRTRAVNAFVDCALLGRPTNSSDRIVESR